MPPKPKYKNHLALIRKKKAVAQKQIAALLGHKTNDQISRYELGVKVPTLKTALKLGIIYDVSLRILFHGYYEMCADEIRRQEKNVNGIAISAINSLNTDSTKEIEFCTVGEKLKPFNVPSAVLDKARGHISELINARIDRMNHR